MANGDVYLGTMPQGWDPTQPATQPSLPSPTPPTQGGIRTPWGTIPTTFNIPGTNVNVDALKAAQGWVSQMSEQTQRAGPAGQARTAPTTPSPQPPQMQVGLGQPGQGPLPNIQGAPPQASPMGGRGALPEAGPFVGTAGPQSPYYSGGETGKGIAANTITGIANLINRTRDQNEKKQYVQATATWNQIVNAYQAVEDAAKQGRTNPDAEQYLQTMIGDDKTRKMLQESLGIVLGKEPGQPTSKQQAQQQKQQAAQQQPEPDTPESSALRNVLKRIERGVKTAGRTVGQMYDPRTQTQRMQGGGQTPVNQPGGISFPLPKPTQEAADMAAIKDMEARVMANIMANEPDMARKMALRDAGLIADPNVQARIDAQAPYLASRISQTDSQTNLNNAKVWKMSQDVQIAMRREDTRAQQVGAQYGSVSGLVTQSYGTPPGTQAGESGSGLYGQQYLDWLANQPKGVFGIPQGFSGADVANMARNVGDYGTPTAQFRTFSNKNPLYSSVMAAVYRYNPWFNAAEYDRNKKALMDFTDPSGKGYQSIINLNQMFNHLAMAYNDYKNLENSGWADWNYFKNWKSQKFDDERNKWLQKFDDDINASANEASVVFKNTSGTDQEIQSWRGNMNDTLGPEGMSGKLGGLMDLARSRINYLQDLIDQAGLRPGTVQVVLPDTRPVIDWLMQQSAMTRAPFESQTQPFRPTVQPPVTGSPAQFSKYGIQMPQ